MTTKVDSHLSNDGFVASEADSFEGRLDSLFVHFLLKIAQHVVQGRVHRGLGGRKSSVSHPENCLIFC